MDLHHVTATAIVVTSKRFRMDPIKFRTNNGPFRYYAFRILKKWQENHLDKLDVIASAPLLARYVGYSTNSSYVISAASQEKKYRLDLDILDELYRDFEKRLYPDTVVELLPAFLPTKSREPVRRDPIPMPKTSSLKQGARELYAMLHEAVKNTGGKSVD